MTTLSTKRRHGEGKLVHGMGKEELMCCGKSLINKENSSMHAQVTPLLDTFTSREDIKSALMALNI